MDNMLGLGIILSLQDKASAGLEALRNRLTILRDVSQDMMQKFDAGAKQMVAGIASMVAGTKAFKVLNNMFGVSVNVAANFEQAMSRVASVSGATGEDLERLTKQARDLGRDTQYSASQVANAQELLARGGFNVNEIISAMPNLLYMAGAEGMGMARAADIAISTLRGFGLEAEDMTRVANVLARTSSRTNTSIDTLGESFKYVAPDARVLKMSFEEVAAVIGVMGDAGIKGSQAGTYLRGAFNKLTSPTKEGQKALDQLGISVLDRTGELKSFNEIMQEFSEKLQGMSGATKKSIFGKIFDTRSSTGMLSVLSGFESGKLRATFDELRNNVDGAAKGMYDRMSSTFMGAIARFQSATEGLNIAIGNHFLPTVTYVVDKLAEFKSWITQLIEAHPTITKAVLGSTAALIALSGAALIVLGALMSIGSLIKMWPMMKEAAVLALSNIRKQAKLAFGSFTKLRVPVVGLVALAAVLYYAWRKNIWGIRDMVEALTQGFKMAFSATEDGIAEVDDAVVAKLRKAGIWDFAVTMGKVFFRVRKFLDGFVKGFKEGIDYIKGAFEWMKGFFSPVVESGQELLKFLGILKPITKNQAKTWEAWGQLLGRIAPIIIGVIAAFKGISIVKTIFSDLTKVILWSFNLLMAHPIIAILGLLAALGIYIYNNWEEISENFAQSMEWWGNVLKDMWQGVCDWLNEQWQGLCDWWNNLTLADIFAPVLNFILNIANYFEEKMNELSAWWNDLEFSDIFAPISDWWNSLELGNIFAPVFDFVLEIDDYCKGKMDELAAWWNNLSLGDIFAPICDFASGIYDYCKGKMDELAAWWNNLSLKDIFAPIYNYAVGLIDDTKKLFTRFKDWIVSLFENLNPFNWELPSWLGGSGSAKVTPQQADTGKKEMTQKYGTLNLAPSYMTAPAPVGHPKARGGIVTRPEFALIGEAGREAVIPLEDRIHGLPLLRQAMNELGVSQKFPQIAQPILQNNFSPIIRTPEVAQAPSTPLLIQQSQNQAAVQSQVQVQDKNVNVNSQVDVKVKSEPVNLYLDGEKVGSTVLRWITRQNVRNGVSSF